MYKRITNLLRPMKTGAYPIRRRKASFMTLNRYRINTLYVDQLEQIGKQHQFVSDNSTNYENLNIIYAGTDNGKVLRIAHYFTNKYFENENIAEETVEVLEEIQLFNTTTPINKIKLLE
jgi:hypothetical protein